MVTKKDTSRVTAKTDSENGSTDVAATMADIMGEKEPTVQECKILTKPKLAVERDRAKARLGEAQMAAARAKDDPDVQLELEIAEADHRAAVEAVAAATRVFEFVAIGRPQVERMMKDHRPTREQLDDHREALRIEGRSVTSDPLRYNEDTFPPALISAACSSPQITLEQATKIWDSERWSRGELAQLFLAAWTVNEIVM